MNKFVNAELYKKKLQEIQRRPDIDGLSCWVGLQIAQDMLDGITGVDVEQMVEEETATRARELFEGLGFYEESDNDDFEECAYIGDNTKVTFCKDQYIEYRHPTMCDSEDELAPQEVSFSCDDVMAMYEKCKELGWLE